MKRAQKFHIKLSLPQILVIIALVFIVIATYLDYSIYSSSKNIKTGEVNGKSVIKLDKDKFDKMEASQTSDITIHQNGSIGRLDPFAALP